MTFQRANYFGVNLNPSYLSASKLFRCKFQFNKQIRSFGSLCYGKGLFLSVPIVDHEYEIQGTRVVVTLTLARRLVVDRSIIPGLAIAKVPNESLSSRRHPSVESGNVPGQKCVEGQSVQFRGSATLSTAGKEGRGAKRESGPEDGPGHRMS